MPNLKSSRFSGHDTADSIVKEPKTQNVIARSEATKQSILSLRGEMDCFASLAMTISTHAFAISRRDAPELLQKFFRPTEGVGNAGCPPHPQPRVQM
jgi:hypothetical protein